MRNAVPPRMVEFDRAAIETTLRAKGFFDLPRPKFARVSDTERSLVLVTGVSLTEFDAAHYTLTNTKCVRGSNERRYMLNQTAAFTLAHLEHSGDVVIAQTDPPNVGRVRQTFSDYINAGRLHILPVETDAAEFIPAVYRAFADLSTKVPVSAIHLVPYESFAASLPEPFKALIAESPDNLVQAVAKRARLYHQMALVAYDLLATSEQKSLRLIGITALAARRVGGNLLVDTAHKLISTNYLETLALEASAHFGDKKLHVIEIAPGIVDSGLYDNPSTRRATVENALINGFPFVDAKCCLSSIEQLPKLSPYDVGLIASFYLKARTGESFHARLSEDVQNLANGGHQRADILSKASGIVKQNDTHAEITRSLPSWALVPGVELGRFAPLRPEGGYQFIPVVPPGQHF